MNTQWYTKKWVGISLHILFWILFFLSPLLLRPVMDNKASFAPSEYRNFFLLHFSNTLMRMALFYSNAYVFVPKLIYRKKYGQYALFLCLSLLVLLFWDQLIFLLLIVGHEPRIWNFFVFNLYPFFFLIIASGALRMGMDKLREDRNNKERETEHLKTELSFLRSQVSPHFMFNVLNNMVALARKKSDELEPSLIKLSSLLRYMLYETDEDKVLLEKEVEYLQSYIDLQKQRFGRNIKININFQQLEGSYTIEPMLLIPFVENAFKHGSGMITNAEIDISLLAKDGILQFGVRNKFNDAIVETRDKTSGIGLVNVKRRLDLLYKKAYSLNIEKKDDWFNVSLELNLH
ncbi:MAG: histidine kinase [Chitinophagaceae bacterium]|nr:MAG: histidine kinase [Chitinophagaceae bacterium]